MILPAAREVTRILVLTTLHHATRKNLIPCSCHLLHLYQEYKYNEQERKNAPTKNEMRATKLRSIVTEPQVNE